MENINKTLSELIEATEAEIIRLGYSKFRIRRFRGVWRRFYEYAKEQGVLYYSQELSAKYLLEKYNYPFEYKGKLKDSVSTNVRGLDMLYQFQEYGLILRKKIKEAQPIPEAFSEMLCRFEEYSFKNGYVKATIDRNKYNFSRFAEYLILQGITNCSDIELIHISGYIRVLSGYGKGAVNEYLYALRRVFKFMYLYEYHKLNLSFAVPRIISRQKTTLPMLWTNEETKKLLAVIDRGHPCGKRDFAVMMLVSRLALREGDIRNLKFENINWETGYISIIQAKTKEKLELPMPEDVGLSIIEYMKYGRPESDLPFVFLRHVVPYEPLIRCYDIIKRCIARAGIEIPKGKARGLHSFRHTLASKMLEKNIPPETISSVLGHASADATTYYMHTNISGLRKCALDIPKSGEATING